MVLWEGWAVINGEGKIHQNTNNGLYLNKGQAERVARERTNRLANAFPDWGIYKAVPIEVVIKE